MVTMSASTSLEPCAPAPVNSSPSKQATAIPRSSRSSSTRRQDRSLLPGNGTSSSSTTPRGTKERNSTGTSSNRSTFKKKELHPYLKAVKGEHAFKLKIDHNNVVAEITVLEGLCENIKKAPGDAIVFHMSGRNDFAAWIKGAVGDWCLARKWRKSSEMSCGDEAALVRVMEERIYKLRSQ